MSNEGLVLEIMSGGQGKKNLDLGLETLKLKVLSLKAWLSLLLRRLLFRKQLQGGFRNSRVTGTQQVLAYGLRFQAPKMGLKKNGKKVGYKKVQLQPHESVDSQESLEMDEYSDEEDEVFVRRDRDNDEADKPLIKRRKKVR